MANLFRAFLNIFRAQSCITGRARPGRGFKCRRNIVPLRQSLLHLALLGLVGSTGLLSAQAPKSIAPGDFDKLHKMIKPQAGESRFQEIPWLLSVWEARKKATAEGKPILVWAGAGGAPTAVC